MGNLCLQDTGYWPFGFAILHLSALKIRWCIPLIGFQDRWRGVMFSRNGKHIFNNFMDFYTIAGHAFVLAKKVYHIAIFSTNVHANVWWANKQAQVCYRLYHKLIWHTLSQINFLMLSMKFELICEEEPCRVCIKQTENCTSLLAEWLTYGTRAWEKSLRLH